MRRPDEIAGEAITSWLAGKRVDYLEGLARAHAELLPEVRAEFGPFKLALGRQMIGQDGMAALRTITAADADRVIDYVLRYRPEHGLVLWKYQPWATTQILELCRWFAGGPLPVRATAVR